jgi:hypothetical protein
MLNVHTSTEMVEQQTRSLEQAEDRVESVHEMGAQITIQNNTFIWE